LMNALWALETSLFMWDASIAAIIFEINFAIAWMRLWGWELETSMAPSFRGLGAILVP
jgi:hypothetical protein